MGREDLIVGERIKKIEELRKLGINPYPNKYTFSDFSEDIKEKYSKLSNDQRTKDNVNVAGRVMTKRDLGKLAFVSLQDSKGKIQIILQKDETEENSLELFKKYVDSGDFIGCKGIVMKTRTGEISILVKKIELITKSIAPLPEKFHGITDEEERLRKRYLDMVMNPDVKKVFLVRAKILEVLRNFMKKNRFVEIETPLLQSVYGGAAAKPFKTYCDAYNSSLFLSIAPELYLKKALVGGFDRVYEITKKFRNEGVDRQHNPEHMTIEWYQGYANYNDGMDLVEEMFKDLAMELFGKLEFDYRGHKINLKSWKRIPLIEAIKQYLNEDVEKIKSDEDAKKIAKKHGIPTDGVTKVNIADELMKLFRDKLIQPTFLIDYPIELAPLAKPKKEDPTKAEIFQPFIGGMELARAYSELNDPAIQEANFNEQEEERKKGNKEAMPTDKDFVLALEHGMPPACGVGFGIERLTMLFTDSETIRDVIMFPFMKPIAEEKIKDEVKEETKKIDKNSEIKKKK